MNVEEAIDTGLRVRKYYVLKRKKRRLRIKSFRNLLRFFTYVLAVSGFPYEEIRYRMCYDFGIKRSLCTYKRYVAEMNAKLKEDGVELE